jgi:RNA polymerase sigma-70 factor (ECF subfamily)
MDFKRLRLALRITGNVWDAEDAVQNAALKAITHREQFRGDSSFNTWLHRIVVNEALQIKRAGKRRAVKLGSLRVLLASSYPADQVERVFFREVVARAGVKLKGTERWVFVLRSRGYSIAEIAKVLGLTCAGTWGAMARVRRKLGARTSTRTKTIH